MRTGAVLAALIAFLTGQAPARERIAVARAFPNPGQRGLFIAAADGGGERPLLPTLDLDYDAAWAPDGRTVVFTSERDGSADLYRVNARSPHQPSGLRRSGRVLIGRPKYRVRQHTGDGHCGSLDDGRGHTSCSSPTARVAGPTH